MIDKKRMLARCLVSGRVLSPLARIRSACRADIPILAYHRIWDIGDEDRFPFDVELVSAGVADFRWQMEYVRQNFDPITFATLLEIVDGEIPAPARPIIITFDDGFEDNYQHAFPILNALDVPATVFLSTGYIGSDVTFWYDRLAYLLLRAPQGEFAIQTRAGKFQFTNDVKTRRKAIRSVLRELKLMPNHRRLEVLDNLEIGLGQGCGEPPAPESRPMNWNQVREMASAGIEFGSHTVTHPILANLNDDELRFELTESRRTIEEQIGKPVSVISYPVGGRTAFNEHVHEAVKLAGYRLGLSYMPGSNPLRRLDHFGLRRQHVERYTERPYFAAMLGLPEVFQ
ncbi:MAG: polysaccharide deacetylase family protein [Planctomycetia bacterium]|nr:polysaccharide deacetylase family protein [Planctomycetia bacterium]